MAASLGAVVLAAGAGSRMGGYAKPLLRRDGEPLLLRQIRLLTEVGIEVVRVVLGYHAMEIAALLERTRWSAADSPVARAALKWTINPTPEQGTASSLRCGLRALPRVVDEALIVLADQPLLELHDLQVLLDLWRVRASGIHLLVPRHDGQPGHPVFIDRVVCDAVLELEPGGGVADWRKSHPAQVGFFDADHARYTTDVDTMEDISALKARYRIILKKP